MMTPGAIHPVQRCVVTGVTRRLSGSVAAIQTHAPILTQTPLGAVIAAVLVHAAGVRVASVDGRVDGLEWVAFVPPDGAGAVAVLTLLPLTTFLEHLPDSTRSGSDSGADRIRAVVGRHRVCRVRGSRVRAVGVVV